MKKTASLLLAAIISVLMMLPCLALDGFHAGSSRLLDMADLLDSADVTRITNALDELSERRQFDVAIITVNTTGGLSVRKYADSAYESCDFGFGDEDDGILLLISMEDRDLYISTSGYGITAFTDAGIEYIGDEIAPYLSDGDYAAAFERFISLADDFLFRAESGSAYDAGNLPREPFSLSWIPISIVIGFVIALITVSVMKGKLKSVRFQRAADRYIKRDSMQLTESRDIYLYNTIVRTPKPKQTSSRGGSSTHTSSSGSRHGGGGRKF